VPLYNPTLTADWLAADQNLIGRSFNTAHVQAGTILPTAGLLNLVRVKLTSSIATNILIHLTVAGGTLTAGQCFAALYNSAGSLFGAGAVTADQAANWQSGGLKVMPLNVAQTVPVGYAYVAFFANGVTLPTLSRGVNSSSAILNAGLSAPNFRYASADSGLTTTMPNSFGAQTGTATAWWVGVS
jgi:hypothetical protein